MNGLIILIPVALFLGGLGLAAFLWSLRSGQYDDLDGAAVRILERDDAGSDRTSETSARSRGRRDQGRR
jgi:cbb3-type cytochrome oxidase maturation protein